MHTKFLAAVAFAALAVTGTSHADLSDSIIFSDTSYDPDTSPIRDMADSFWLEDFEDDVVAEGFSFLGAGMLGDDPFTDSIEPGGRSLICLHDGDPNNGSGLTILFDGDITPTVAGIVWTDGNPLATVVFRVFDKDGLLIGELEREFGDGLHDGDREADRLLGAAWEDGIGRLEISASFGSMEFDHLQFGYGAGTVVPLPAPVAMGLLGLAGVGIASRRRRQTA